MSVPKFYLRPNVSCGQCGLVLEYEPWEPALGGAPTMRHPAAPCVLSGRRYRMPEIELEALSQERLAPTKPGHC